MPQDAFVQIASIWRIEASIHGPADRRLVVQPAFCHCHDSRRPGRGGLIESGDRGRLGGPAVPMHGQRQSKLLCPSNVLDMKASSGPGYLAAS